MFNKKNIKMSILSAAILAFGSTSVSATEVTDQLSISGKAYFGLQNNKTDNFNSATGTTTTANKSTGLSVDRFYLQAKYQVNDQWFGTIVTDVNNEQNTVPGLKRSTNVFLKYAYVEGKFSDEVQVRLGLSNTPWIGYEEKLWAHRYVSNVYTDFFKMDDSADYGLGLKGKFMDDMLEYWLTYSNGGGYGKPNATQAMDISGRFTVHPIEGMDISLGFRDGYRGNKRLVTNAVTGVIATAANPIKETLNQVLLSYGQETWRVGGNFVINNKKDNTSTVNKATGYNVWAWARFAEDYGVFARYDYLKSTPLASTFSAKTSHYIVGLEYFETQGMTFSLALDNTKVTNGNAAWTATALNDTSKTTKVGLYSEFRF
ncbi:MAG: hypothetical protein Q9M28_02850 [Mariprofundaceae bacterium]|nr:hypothetical protein [Mariprofundaceae bacterium]